MHLCICISCWKRSVSAKAMFFYGVKRCWWMKIRPVMEKTGIHWPVFFLKEIVSRVWLFSEFLLAYVISNIRENSPGGVKCNVPRRPLWHSSDCCWFSLPCWQALEGSRFHCLKSSCDEISWGVWLGILYHEVKNRLKFYGVEFFVEKSFLICKKKLIGQMGFHRRIVFGM